MGASVSFEQGTKHDIMVLTVGTESRRIAVTRAANGKRCQHQEDWVRQDVRKYFKEIKCSMQTPSSS